MGEMQGELSDPRCEVKVTGSIFLCDTSPVPFLPLLCYPVLQAGQGCESLGIHDIYDNVF